MTVDSHVFESSALGVPTKAKLIQAQSTSQAQWLVPCSNKLCRNLMQTLNPSDNWVKDKGTSVDHEDDEETSETGNGQ